MVAQIEDGDLFSARDRIKIQKNTAEGELDQTKCTPHNVSQATLQLHSSGIIEKTTYKILYIYMSQMIIDSE